jgi:hypothetical protein
MKLSEERLKMLRFLAANKGMSPGVVENMKKAGQSVDDMAHAAAVSVTPAELQTLLDAYDKDNAQ